jgi:hypothetical protein
MAVSVEVVAGIAGMVHYDLHCHRGSPVFALCQRIKQCCWSAQSSFASLALSRHDVTHNESANWWDESPPSAMLSGLTLLATCLCACAETFEDLWLTRIKPPPYGSVVTEIDDTIAANGKRLHPYRDLVCAHILERIGQRRREVDLTPPASKAIGCDGMCKVSQEQVAQ